MAPILMLALWKTNLEPHLDWKIDPDRFLVPSLKVFHIGMSHNGISEYPKITCHIEVTNCIDISS